MLAYLSI